MDIGLECLWFWRQYRTECTDGPSNNTNLAANTGTVTPLYLTISTDLPLPSIDRFIWVPNDPLYKYSNFLNPHLPKGPRKVGPLDDRFREVLL